MLSKYQRKLVAFRINSMKICGGAVIAWDNKKQEVTKSHNFFYWTWCLHTTGGFIYSALMVLHVMTKMEEAENEDEMDINSIATNIVGIGEASVTTCICLLAVVISRHREDVIRLFNELYRYNDIMMERLTREGKKLQKRHKIMMHQQEMMMIMLVILTIFLPLSIGTIFTHPMEATGRMLREWFELDIKLTFSYLPVIVIFGILLFAASNAAVILCIAVAMYYSVSTLALVDMMPKKLAHGGATQIRCKFVTNGYDTLEDTEIINLYRIQQLFNEFLNSILKSVMISFHHVACLAAVVSMSFFAIRFYHVLDEVGILGYAIVLGSLFAPLFLIITESLMFGMIADKSDEFARTGKDMLWRKAVYRKFLKSCQTFYVQEAYPFYNIHKETMLMFGEVAMGQLMDLLLM